MNQTNARELELANFEDALRSGKVASVEDWLESRGGGHTEELLLELVHAEYRFARGENHDHSPDRYFERFPDLKDRLRRLFEVESMLDTSLEENGDSTHDPELTCSIGEDSTDKEGEAEIPTRSIPRQFGRYEIKRLLGEGGFASVYLAWDVELQREVAIKAPRLDRMRQLSAESFVDEARKVAQLEHPAIVSVHDVQRLGDQPFIVMQYIDGGDMTHYIRDRSHAFADLLHVFLSIVDAVGYAHQRGYVHLDLKPSNILLDKQKQPYVGDFGLALHRDAQREKRGQVMGTPVYMSPEQARGDIHQLDGRSDIWSLGVILYQLLTGIRPFDGSGRELLEDIEKRDPRPPRQVNPAVPTELSRICLKCLAKQATERYPSTADLSDDVQQWLAQDSSPAPALSKPSNASLSIKILGISITIAVALSLMVMVDWRDLRTDPMAAVVKEDATRATQTQNDTAAVGQELKFDDGQTDMLSRAATKAEVSANSKTPGPPAPAAPSLSTKTLRPLLDGVHFEHFANGDDGSIAGPLFRNGKIHEEDDLRIEVTLDEPSYCFLFALNPDGSVQLCYPEGGDDAVQAEPVNEFQYPSDSGMGFAFTDGSGQQSFVLVRSVDPLPSFEDWIAPFADPAKRRSDSSGRWLWDEGGLKPWVSQSAVRGAPRPLKGAEPFGKLMEEITAKNPQLKVSGVCFPVSPVE